MINHAPYDPLSDLSLRHPDWSIAVGDMHEDGDCGPIAVVNPFARQMIVNPCFLEVDKDYTLAYLVGVLDLDSSWPLASEHRDRAAAMARTRLAR
jgi:hypothetical protein